MRVLLDSIVDVDDGSFGVASDPFTLITPGRSLDTSVCRYGFARVVLFSTHPCCYRIGVLDSDCAVFGFVPICLQWTPSRDSDMDPVVLDRGSQGWVAGPASMVDRDFGLCRFLARRVYSDRCVGFDIGCVT